MSCLQTSVTDQVISIPPFRPPFRLPSQYLGTCLRELEIVFLVILCLRFRVVYSMKLVVRHYIQASHHRRSVGYNISIDLLDFFCSLSAISFACRQ